MALDSSLFRAELRVDPLSRCAALALPKDAIAILPFYQTQAELDVMEQDQARYVSIMSHVLSALISSITTRDVPYSPSFILDLGTEVDDSIRNMIDFVFLPGFHNPTIAVMFQVQQTWTG
jgi:cleavage and polyadenylation specificity factor subunit 1